MLNQKTYKKKNTNPNQVKKPKRIRRLYFHKINISFSLHSRGAVYFSNIYSFTFGILFPFVLFIYPSLSQIVRLLPSVLCCFGSHAMQTRLRTVPYIKYFRLDMYIIYTRLLNLQYTRKVIPRN